MILPGIHDSLPMSMSENQPEYMYSIRIVHSVLLPSAKPFKGQRSGTPTIVLHSSGHSIPFQSSPVHSTIPFHRFSPPNPYTRYFMGVSRLPGFCGLIDACSYGGYTRHFLPCREGPGDEATPVQACVDVMTACFKISSCKLLVCLSNSVEGFA